MKNLDYFEKTQLFITFLAIVAVGAYFYIDLVVIPKSDGDIALEGLQLRAEAEKKAAAEAQALAKAKVTAVLDAREATWKEKLGIRVIDSLKKEVYVSIMVIDNHNATSSRSSSSANSLQLRENSLNVVQETFPGWKLFISDRLDTADIRRNSRRWKAK